MNALGCKVAQAFLIDLNLMVSVGAAVLDGLHYRQTLHYAPAHSITLNVRLQVVNLLAGPHLAKRYVVQGCYNALHTNLSQHGKRNLVFLAKPAPCSFHISIIVFRFLVQR